MVIVDSNGKPCTQFDGDPLDMVDGEKSVMSAGGALKDARLWSCGDPAMYDVYSMLKVNNKVVDVYRIETGFRKTEFKGGAGTGGVYVNEKFVYLKGFSQRSADEWAAVGAGYPTGCTITLPSSSAIATATTCAGCTSRRRRWMRIPSRVSGSFRCVRPEITERDSHGRQWDQRIEVMREFHDLLPQ